MSCYQFLAGCHTPETQNTQACVNKCCVKFPPGLVAWLADLNFPNRFILKQILQKREAYSNALFIFCV
jgi:hypothetical protein